MLTSPSFMYTFMESSTDRVCKTAPRDKIPRIWRYQASARDKIHGYRLCKTATGDKNNDKE